MCLKRSSLNSLFIDLAKKGTTVAENPECKETSSTVVQ